MAAEDPDDQAIILAIATEAKGLREAERKELAFEIGEGTRKVIGG